jgi:hypothetical protein
MVVQLIHIQVSAPVAIPNFQFLDFHFWIGPFQIRISKIVI